MPFNSPIFLACFLPISFLGVVVLSWTEQQGWVALWWNPWYVPLMLASITFNCLFRKRLVANPSRKVLTLGILANLLLLAWYQYKGPAATTLDQPLGLGWTVPSIVLPLAISFEFLCDAPNGAPVQLLALTDEAYLTQALERSINEAVYFNLSRLVPIILLLALVWGLPNTHQWLRHCKTALAYQPKKSWLERLSARTSWWLNPLFGSFVGAIEAFAAVRALSRASTEFHYFQF